MKTFEKPKRRFLSTVLTASMTETAKGCDLKIDKETYTIDILRGKNFISALTSDPLASYLQSEGILDAKVNPEKTIISLQEGDELYVINPNYKLHKLKEGEKLPPHVTVTVTKYEVTK